MSSSKPSFHPGRSAREKFSLSGSLKRTKASHLIYFYPQT